MTISTFNASDWVYVADSMGRLGQGYYKNRSNPNQTITTSEFEKRRTQAPSVSVKNKEQIINKTPTDSPQTQEQSAELTPWDNPMVGEQLIQNKGEAVKPVEAKPTPVQAVKGPKPSEKQANVPQDNPDKGNGPGSQGENDGAGEGEAGKVICTELTRQGLMSERARKACTLYAYRYLDQYFLNGYHFWAVPYVRWMRRSTLATALIKPFVKYRTQEVCSRLGLQSKGSWFGKVICGLHDPLCRLVGRVVSKTDYHSLYEREAV